MQPVTKPLAMIASTAKPQPTSLYPYSAAVASSLAVLPVAGLVALDFGLHYYLPAVAARLIVYSSWGWLLCTVPLLCGVGAVRIFLRHPAACTSERWKCGIWVWAWLWLLTVVATALIDKQAGLTLIVGFPFFLVYHLAAIGLASIGVQLGASRRELLRRHQRG